MRTSSIYFCLSLLCITDLFASKEELDISSDLKPSSSEVKVNSEAVSETDNKSVAEVPVVPPKPILKVKAKEDGGCSNLIAYPYVYYGKSKDSKKTKEGEYDVKSKYYVNIEFLEQQKSKRQTYYVKCNEVLTKINLLMNSLGKESPLWEFFSSTESGLRAGLASYKVEKITRTSPQSELDDVVKFKRILKYKYIEDIRSFAMKIKTANEDLQTILETFSKKEN